MISGRSVKLRVGEDDQEQGVAPLEEGPAIGLRVGGPHVTHHPFLDGFFEGQEGLILGGPVR